MTTPTHLRRGIFCSGAKPFIAFLILHGKRLLPGRQGHDPALRMHIDGAPFVNHRDVLTDSLSQQPISYTLVRFRKNAYYNIGIPFPFYAVFPPGFLNFFVKIA